MAARAAARPLASSTRRSPRRCAPSGSRSSTTLQRLAARGKLHAALAWIDDFLASGEPLVVFARHVEVQEAVLERFPDALHLLGRDSIAAREAAVRAFQEPATGRS